MSDTPFQVRLAKSNDCFSKATQIELFNNQVRWGAPNTAVISGALAYLESSRDINVPLYERHGYEVTAEDTMAGGGPTAWFMLRQPQSPAP